jgi:hypothetical protein
MSKVAPEPPVESSKRQGTSAPKSQNVGRSLVISKEEIDDMVTKEVLKREQLLRESLEKEIEAKLEAKIEKKYEEKWQGKVDIELEKNDTWSARIKGADDRAQLAERKLFVCEEKLDTQAKEHAKKLKQMEASQNEMKVTLKQSISPVNSLSIFPFAKHIEYLYPFTPFSIAIYLAS